MPMPSERLRSGQEMKQIAFRCLRGICVKLVACRRSLISAEFTTYSRALRKRTLLRICQASNGC